MEPFTFVLILIFFTCGMVLGKWVTDSRWSGNAREIQRLSHHGRLYKVFDVTPWDDSTKKDRERIGDP